MKTTIKRFLPALLLFGITICAALPAIALPYDWQMGFQPAASPGAERLQSFYNVLLYIMVATAVFVALLLLWVLARYNKWVNPVPQQFSHNVVIEVVWTVLPVLILLAIALPSMRLLYYLDRTKTPEMTLKVTGYQWYWGYEYPDAKNGDISFMSYMIPDNKIDKSKGQVRMLSTDNPVVLPVDTNIRIWTTAADVIHSWSEPQLGVKIDAVPGHLNETWVRITQPGEYYGECSQLCGKDHSYMPIEIKAVSKEDFAAWVKTKSAGAKPAAAAAKPAAAPATQK